MEKNKIVLPDYENSILNLINSILHYYHVETKYNGLDVLNKKLEKQYQNINYFRWNGRKYIKHDFSKWIFKKASRKKNNFCLPFYNYCSNDYILFWETTYRNSDG